LSFWAPVGVGVDAARRHFRYNRLIFRAASGLARTRSAAADFPLQTRMSPMLETNPIHHLIKDLSERTDVLRGYL